MTDFVSVGTNDLMQYLFAADRGNPRVSDRYDFLSPPALRALEVIQKACAETGTPVSICGEMAGRPLEAFALVALGFDRLSMPPAGIGPVKQMVLSCDREAARRGMTALLKSSAGSVRNESKPWRARFTLPFNHPGSMRVTEHRIEGQGAACYRGDLQRTPGRG
jgi:phosphotransferase system enzyme I (PtsP)